MDPAADPELLAAGTRVEVRNGFDGGWSRGFTVVAATSRGYRLRRRSDGTVLPTTFAVTDVRHEHNRSLWWI